MTVITTTTAFQTSTQIIAKGQANYLASSSSSSLALHARVSSNDSNDIDSTFHTNTPVAPADVSRRRLLFQTIATVTTTMMLGTTAPAFAAGLIQFPIGTDTTQPLKNTYHFMRAGRSELELDGIYSTNPLFLTNRENAMDASASVSIQETTDLFLKNPNSSPTIMFHSLAANGMDTGDLMARQLRMGREKLLPEFTYLDPRGIGLWDSGEEALVKPAIWALDYLEADKVGAGGRPPPPPTTMERPTKRWGINL